MLRRDLGEGSDHFQLIGCPAPRDRSLRRGEFFLAPLQRAVFASLRALFFINFVLMSVHVITLACVRRSQLLDGTDN